MHKIITCAGYGASGSGVVTDYLSEFSCINNFGDYEFRFIQDYMGVSTLEDALVHNHHRLNSDIAIQNFIKYINFQSGDFTNSRYETFFKGEFKKISYRFLDKIIDLKWEGYWEEYQILEPKWIMIFKYKIFPRLIKLLSGNKKYIAHYLPKKTMYLSNPTYDYFIQCVREYMDDLCSAIDPDKNKKYIYFDQLLPPRNINRYLNYFGDIRVVVVDRDPRDYYIENVCIWGEGWVPKDIDKFVVYYKELRKKQETNEDKGKILRINFEEAVYKYDEFKNMINNFLFLEEKEHTHPLEKFDPSKSAKNTQLWKKHKVNHAIISKIEKELEEYCYKF